MHLLQKKILPYYTTIMVSRIWATTFFLHMIESASFNKGHTKLYAGVAPNLVAFACKKSFEKGYAGHLVFVAKSALIKHYQDSLGAKLLFGARLFIDSEAAYRLVRRYFKDFNYKDFTNA